MVRWEVRECRRRGVLLFSGSWDLDAVECVLSELPGVGKGFRASSDLDSLCSVIHYVPGVYWGESFYGGFEKQGAACYAIGSSDWEPGGLPGPPVLRGGAQLAI